MDKDINLTIEHMDSNLLVLHRALRHYCKEHYSEKLNDFMPIKISPVYYTYTLGSWKGIFIVHGLSKTLFEVVYNNRKNEIYVVDYVQAGKQTFSANGLPLKKED